MTDEIKELDNQGDEKSFAELLEQSGIGSDFLRPGQKVEAVIVKITPEWIFLALGGKSEGYLDRRELQDEEGNLSVKEGDRISAYFLSSKHNEKLLTTKVGSGEAGQAFLEEAYQNGIPVEGLVEKEIKGGYEIKVVGNVRGFCPFSQMGLQKTDDPQGYIGKKLTFRIVEYGEKGRKLVLSSRAILEEEQRQRREEIKGTLKEGMVLKGKVVSLLNFGAFVDLDGIQGLIPMSELGWARVENIHDVLVVGQEVEVRIIKLDWEKDQIGLSLKQCLPDPWDTVDQTFFEGSVHTGCVVRLMNFGAFVNLAPGIDGLIHISKLGKGKRINHPGEVVAVGQTLKVQVENTDREQKRVSLALVRTEKEENAAPGEGEDYRQFIEKPVTSLGSLGDLLKFKTPGVKKTK
jgi:small subunit ribosomal protein S1